MSNTKKNTKKNKKATSKKLSSKAVVLIIVCAVVAVSVLVVGGIHLYNHVIKKPEELPAQPNSPAMHAEQDFSDGSDVFEESHYKITARNNENIEELINEFKIRDERMGSYQIVQRVKGVDGFFEVNYWTENGKGIYEYNFGGLNVGIDLSGVYYRTRIDELDTIVNYKTQDHITQGEFFDKYFAPLSSITLDNMLSEALSAGFVDAGTNENGDTVITSGDVSICVSNKESRDTWITEKRDGKVYGYYISYGKHYSMP